MPQQLYCVKDISTSQQQIINQPGLIEVGGNQHHVTGLSSEARRSSGKAWSGIPTAATSWHHLIWYSRKFVKYDLPAIAVPAQVNTLSVSHSGLQS